MQELGDNTGSGDMHESIRKRDLQKFCESVVLNSQILSKHRAHLDIQVK